jgi:hypothetical protein
MTKPEPTTKSPRDYRKHGLTRLLRSRMRQLDGRSALSQSIARYRAELLSSLGEAENLISMELTILETCSRDWILLQCIDAYILQTGAFNKKRRQTYSLTIQRMQIADSLPCRLNHATGFSFVSEKSPKLCSVIPRSLPRGASLCSAFSVERSQARAYKNFSRRRNFNRSHRLGSRGSTVSGKQT